MLPKSKPVDGVLAIFGKAAPKGAAKPEAASKPAEPAGDDTTKPEAVPPAAGAALDELKIPTDAHPAWCRFVRAVVAEGE